MMDFFSQVIDFLVVLADLLVNGLKALIILLTEIPRWIGFTYVLYSYLPPVLLSFAILAISLSLLFLLLGRSS